MKIPKIILLISVLTLAASCSTFNSKNLESVVASKVIVVNSAIGQFFFTAKEKEKLDEGGYKFEFIIGNPSNAQYEDLVVNVRWGKKPSGKKSKINVKNLKSAKVKIETLKAGQWQEFSVVIPAKNESEMAVLSLIVSSVEGISLSKAEEEMDD